MPVLVVLLNGGSEPHKPLVIRVYSDSSSGDTELLPPVRTPPDVVP